MSAAGTCQEFVHSTKVQWNHLHVNCSIAKKYDQLYVVLFVPHHHYRHHQTDHGQFSSICLSKAESMTEEINWHKTQMNTLFPYRTFLRTVTDTLFCSATFPNARQTVETHRHHFTSSCYQLKYDSSFVTSNARGGSDRHNYSVSSFIINNRSVIKDINSLMWNGGIFLD